MVANDKQQLIMDLQSRFESSTSQKAAKEEMHYSVKYSLLFGAKRGEKNRMHILAQTALFAAWWP